MPNLWDNPTAVHTLARIVFGIAQIPPTISYQKMSDSIKSEEGTIINHQNIRNFAIRNTYKFASIHGCEVMIKYILNILQHDQNQATKRFIKECIDDYDIVGAYSMRDQIALSPHPVQTYIAGDVYTSTLDLMKNFFNISLDSFEKVSSLFTTCGKRLPHISRDQDRGFYICYR